MSLREEVEHILQDVQGIFDATEQFCSFREEIQELEVISGSWKQFMLDMNQFCDEMEVVIEKRDDEKISPPELVHYELPEKIDMNLDEIMVELNKMDLERINSSESNKRRSSYVQEYDDDDNARDSVSNSESVGIVYNEKLKRKEATV